MKRPNCFRWALLISANALVLCVLSFNQAESAAPGAAGQRPDLADRQRAEMIIQLRQINAQLTTLVEQRITGALPEVPPSTPIAP